MNKIVLRDLAESRELDRQAMVAIMGSGIWGTVKKYSRKVGRYGKKRIQSKYRVYKQMYRLARSVPGILYRGTKSMF